MVHSANETKWISSEENQKLMTVWPDIVRDLTEAAKNCDMLDVAEWIEKVLQYTVIGGKNFRPLILVHAYKLLASSDELTEENIRLAQILAWCAEFINASYLIVDDVMDKSVVRRGKPCWYRYANIGTAAINDGLLVENAIYYIIRKYFKEKDYYVNLLEIFQKAYFITAMGQVLDLFTNSFNKKPKLDLFTMDRFDYIAHYKTSHYSFLMPVIAAMQLAGIKDPKVYKQIEPILIEMGRLYQVQNDYLDCFGDYAICGKDDTDIEEGKCTWFIVEALQRATSEQRKSLEECYGCSDPKKVKRVRQIFTDLDLPNTYFIFEKEAYNQLNVQIQQISSDSLRNLLMDILRLIYRRVA